MSTLIDKAVEYIEAKNASYLAKEGLVVYFTSITGRKSDQVWVKHSMTETIRIIRATLLSTDCELREHHVLAAFQELGRVFEYGAKSRHKISEGVFNYFEHSNTSLVNQAAIALADVLLMRGLKAVLGRQVFGLYFAVLDKLDEGDSTSSEVRDALISAMENLGYEHKTGSRRVQYMKTKMNVFMMPSTKPSQITDMSGDMSNLIIQQVYGGLK